MFKKSLAISLAALATLIALAVLTACAGGASEGAAAGGGAAGGSPAGGSPAAGGPTRDSLTMNMTADINNLDPANTASAPDSVVFHQIFNRLVDNTEHGFVPALAERWEVAPDGLSYTFYLRQDVTFHNGLPLTARDVVFTFERAQLSPFQGAPLAPIAAFVAVDDFTVRFDLHHQFAPLLSATQMIWIVSEQVYLEEGEAFGRHPIGTGAYKFVSHQPGQSVHLTRFEDHFRGVAPIRDVNLMVILNPATVAIAVEAGDIDLAVHAPVEDLVRLAGLEHLGATPFATSHLNFITINVNMAPFDNPLVRQAIAHAIDRESYVIMVSDGFGTTANGFLNALTFGYSPDITQFPFDVERARQLLAEAGYPDGLDLTIRTIGGAFDSQAQVIQGQLSMIGINARIELMDQAAFLNDLFTGNYEVGVLAVSLPDDADAWAVIFTSDGGMNMMGHSNPEIDRLFTEGRTTVDVGARQEIYRQVAQHVNDDSAFIPVFFTGAKFIHDRDLNIGWVDSSGSFRIFDVTWSN